MKILYIAYPLLPVSEESCGGAEQMLIRLEQEMNSRGHETVVAACAGSRVAGELHATGTAPPGTDQFEERSAEHNRQILDFLRQQPEEFDLIHDESGTFWQGLGDGRELPAAMLVTLHLARPFYSAEAFSRVPFNVFFNCVSEAQAASFRDVDVTVVRNGIKVEGFPVIEKKGEYLLWLGRICEEKGAHLAIEVAQRTGRPLVIAGQVYPFSYHQEYFQRKILPHLDGETVRWAESPNIQEKLELLRGARAVLVPSLVEETSSLVAMEAMACGTPVIGLRRGAIPEVVAEGRTGLVVDSVEEMMEAVERVGDIGPQACRNHVERHYSAKRMADDYERLYQRIIGRPPG